MPNKHICLRIPPEHLEIIEGCMKILKTENMTEAILTMIEDWGRPSTPQHSVTKWESFPCLMRVLYEGKQEYCTDLDKNRPIAIPSRFVKVEYCQACYVARNRMLEKKISPSQLEYKISQPPKVKKTVSFKIETVQPRKNDDTVESFYCALKRVHLLTNSDKLDFDECLHCPNENCRMKSTLKAYQ